MYLEIFDLGLTDYKYAWEFQKDIFNKVKSGILPSALIICRHNPVITLGRKESSKENIIASSDTLLKKNISIYSIERGGDVTYHGPGQLTVYPIFNLNYLKKDIHWFIRELEQIVIDLLWDNSVIAKRIPGLSGVWIGDQKICSIGISIRNWITFHGLTINIKKDDLNNFSLIRPCGMDIIMTSLESQGVNWLEPEEITHRIINKFAGRFAFNLAQEALA